MEWLNDHLTYLIAALVVLAVVILAVMVIKAVGGRVRGRRGSRLGISEYHEVDKTRRLVLVRRDGVEHLLLIGGEQDLVVETGIGNPGVISAEQMRRAAPIRPPAAEEQSESPTAGRPAPRPAVFGDRLPSLRPVGRDEPRLASGRKFEGDEQA